MPHLIYIGQTPAEGTGSPVIVLRHLQRLSARGWKITIIGEHGQDPGACEKAGWAVQYLPLRRSWWPPFRQDKPMSRVLRTWLLAREICSLWSDTPPDAIFAYLAAHADFSAEIASKVAIQADRPLTLLIHDDAAAFEQDPQEKLLLRKRHARIMRAARRCWFVSPELAASYEVSVEERRVLWPIPQGWDKPARWQAKFAHQLRVYYAGFIWPAQYALLAKIARALDEVGGRLVLLSRRTPELNAFVGRKPIDWLEPFPTNREALVHLVSDAAGLLISYAETVEEMPWIATSFPSKFVEYAHLGLPCALVAPTASSLGAWADRSAYASFFTPDRLDDFRRWAEALKSEGSWNVLAKNSQQLAAHDFNPELIQSQWEAGLVA